MPQFTEEIEQDDFVLVSNACKQCLGSDWKSKTISIKRFADGYFNKIFFCQIIDSDKDWEPIVVKVSLKEDFFLYSHLYSLTNTLIISEAKLGPKVLSVFPDGVITQYIESRTFGREDYENPKIVRLLAQKLAKFHSLDSPTPKDITDKWIYNVIDDFLEMEQSSNGNGGVFDCVKGVYHMIESSEYQFLKRLDFSSQLFWVKKAILRADKILVFSHSDLNRGNILIDENSGNLDIFFIDFDFSGHNFRGIDFGRYFSSWKQKDPNFGHEDYPTDQQMYPFIDAYIEEWNRLTGNQFSKNELNSREHIIKEAKLFTLMGVLIDVLFCIWKVGAEPDSGQEFLEKGDKRYQFYLSLKERFQNENSV